MGVLTELPNIGEVIEKQLNLVGIMTYEQLRECGSEQAWLKIRLIDSSACIHRLYALEGAIQGRMKSLLPPETKEELKEFYNAFSK
ncbi:competence protein TfoX [Alkalibaculum sp. M08DMB]|uniref:Competence protein TfoX n=1 Tax=Alkalibaculum sporogenes TaxID=2655001 RepID=A0A6A7K6U9_9FIRM|nr:TfoX/Sxy family protein [Alkalibaculum sporogenes]MPW25229.1 competence protein TfoX [Alkalibaculum sporogenes]